MSQLKFCIDKRYDIDDDIEALLINNLKCSMVLSNPCNIKITYKSDIDKYKKIIMNDIRIGFGYDFHKLINGKSISLAGVEIQSNYSVSAHSDGDILLHALSDAIYGSIADGDIGTHFPSDDQNLDIDIKKNIIACMRHFLMILAIKLIMLTLL